MFARVFAAVLTLAVCLSGCSKDANDEINKQPDDQSAVAGDLSFELNRGEEPSFDDVFMEEDTSVSEGSEPEPMYIEKDGYAYQIDPATLDVIEVPLDPVTHEPVLGDTEHDVELPDVPADPRLELEEEVVDPIVNDDNTVVEESPSAQTPNNDNKYPNTGIFLEDD